MKILNFGSLNIDYVYHVDHFVRAGETLSSANMEIFCGGKGLNQSLALRKSGAKVYHAGAVGETDGDVLLRELEKAGVDTAYITRKDGKTGHAIIQKNPEGQNCILLYGGANQEITRAQVDDVLSCFSEGDFLLLQNEISELRYIMEQAHKKGMNLVLNPSPMNSVLLDCPLEYVDYFLLNEIEAQDICGKEEDGEKLLERLSKKFPAAKILLTLGEKGSLYFNGSIVLKQKSYRVKAVDTTAAGDTFTGYFVGGLTSGETQERALDNAARAAAIAVSRLGAAPSIPERAEVEKYVFA